MDATLQAFEARDRLEAENRRLKARERELVGILQWLDMQGGLGFDKHDRIRAVLAKT